MSEETDPMIARQAVQGSLYSVVASAITLALGFIRSVALARLLLPEHFGVLALALFFVNLVGQLRGLGMDSALVHRKKLDEGIRATFFTAQITITALSLVLLAVVTPQIARFYPEVPLLSLALYVLIGISLLKSLNNIQQTMLSRQLNFRAIAVTDVASSIAMTVVAPYLAWRGFGIWSLLAEQFTGIFIRLILIWGPFRVWNPRLGLDTEAARWFWRFGVRVWHATNITFLLDRFDDFWTGTILGQTPLGYYSRAYEFAGYPRRVVANPVASVFFPTFARLQDDRLRLSRAFFRLNSLMIRLGVWFSLCFILAAPEFIELVLGPKWLPMSTAFQLMIVYTILDPLTTSASHLLTAIGQPGLILRTRMIQLAVFLPAVIGLIQIWGIVGVALAADIMILTGALQLFRYTRRFIDYSVRHFLLWPLVALTITAVAVYLSSPLWELLSTAVNMFAKWTAISVLFWGLLWLMERDQLRDGWKMIWGLARPMIKHA